MCFFESENGNRNGEAYKKGVTLFKCGACPECLRDRANHWALRAVYEAKSSVHNCMITLTYDSFEYDKFGKRIGEKPVNPALSVNKRDIQLFMKRLRKHFTGQKIKYICCAEYGNRTHRAHYHMILFNCTFDDAVYYKKSKRGNPIYMSHTLTKLWRNGICTIDSIRVHSAVARYCTKYCAKSRSDDTFMLCSQGIGLENLMKDFNGRSYMIEGREYTVPKIVWQRYITEKYNDENMTYKYVNCRRDLLDFEIDEDFEINKVMRKRYRKVRDNDSLYKQYLIYWQKKGKHYEKFRLPDKLRILALDESRYSHYKLAALQCFGYRNELSIPLPAPNSNCLSEYFHYLEERRRKFHLPYFSS